MKPLAEYERNNPPLPSDAPEFDEDVNLSVLIDAAIKSSGPLAIVDSDKARIGAITRADLLRTVVEGTETS